MNTGWSVVDDVCVFNDICIEVTITIAVTITVAIAVAVAICRRVARIPHILTVGQRSPVGGFPYGSTDVEKATDSRQEACEAPNKKVDPA